MERKRSAGERDCRRAQRRVRDPRKIENVLASDYPREQLEVLIGSDGSSDRTEEIVQHTSKQASAWFRFLSNKAKARFRMASSRLRRDPSSFSRTLIASLTSAIRIIVETLDDLRRPRLGDAAIRSSGNDGDAKRKHVSELRIVDSRAGKCARPCWRWPPVRCSRSGANHGSRWSVIWVTISNCHCAPRLAGNLHRRSAPRCHNATSQNSRRRRCSA